MGLYFFTMIQTHHRTGERIGVTTGVVQGNCESEAIEKAWELVGSDWACCLEVCEIDLEDGYKFTVYKSSI